MTRVLLASRSRGKLAEFRALIATAAVEVVTPDDLGLAETADELRLEAFDTFVDNARAKAVHFAWRSGVPALADDSGLEVDALGGAPGVWSKRFAGVDGLDHEVTAANNRELLERLHDVPVDRRGAGYRCVLVLAWPDGRELVADGITRGRIGVAPVGTGGFGYDPLFVSDDLGATFGTVAPEEKARVSHRGRALTTMRSQWPWG